MRDGLFGPTLPPTRFYRVRSDARCPSLAGLSDAEQRTFMLLCMRLKFIAGEIEPNETGIRAIAFSKWIITLDGLDFAPLCVYFRMADHNRAYVVEFESIEETKSEVIVSDFDCLEVFRREYRELLKKRRR